MCSYAGTRKASLNAHAALRPVGVGIFTIRLSITRGVETEDRCNVEGIPVIIPTRRILIELVETFQKIKIAPDAVSSVKVEGDGVGGNSSRTHCQCKVSYSSRHEPKRVPPQRSIHCHRPYKKAEDCNWQILAGEDVGVAKVGVPHWYFKLSTFQEL